MVDEIAATEPKRSFKFLGGSKDRETLEWPDGGVSLKRTSLH